MSIYRGSSPIGVSSDTSYIQMAAAEAAAARAGTYADEARLAKDAVAGTAEEVRLVLESAGTLGQLILAYTPERQLASIGQTVFTLVHPYPVGFPNGLVVYIDGFRLPRLRDYAETNSTTITFNSPFTKEVELEFVVGLEVGTGIVGATGPQGIQGIQGIQGATGPTVTVPTATVLKGSGGALTSATAGTDYLTPTGNETVTNKRVTTRVGSTASSATPAINTNLYDVYKLTAQAVAITSMTSGLTGTPTDNQVLIIEITGTAAVAITWGASFESSTITLPTTTVTTAMLAVGFLWNTATSKWRCVAAV